VTVALELNDRATPPGGTPGVDQCGETTFGLPPLSPACVFNARGNKLTCK
jgi:hypothetical protein